MSRDKESRNFPNEIKERQTKLTGFTIPERPSYPQNWQVYDAAQCGESTTFLKLLSDLCTHINQPSYQFGRPCLPYSDIVFASALKVYTTFSYRRFMSSMKKAVEDGYVQTYCSYSSIASYMRKPDLTPILEELIRISSIPLIPVESVIAVDASGFGTSTFSRYFSYKHLHEANYRSWIKANIACGVKTGIVTSVIITEENKGDVSLFGPLVEDTAKRFTIQEILADKAYSSRRCYELATELEAIAFIPFKKNATGKSFGSGTWSKMYSYFMLHRDEFMKHYHQRSNIESTFAMVKKKFGPSVRSRDITAQKNEVLLKILCHNICVVNQEIHELGIKADFISAGTQD
ncbi:MAG: hypothetical protein HMLIMOIP_002379 [Candidatus Nitrosomirales archaeon]